MRLEGRRAFVTGAAGGIGLAIAQRLNAQGASVVLADVDGTRLRDAAASLEHGTAIEVDVTDPTGVDTAIEQGAEVMGGLDVLVNSAGVDDPRAKAELGAARAEERPLRITAELDDERWRCVMAVNLDGAFHTIRAVLPLMYAAGRGAIVNISSVAGRQGLAGYPHYSASKAGLLGLTQAVAREVAADGIRVNAVCPGVTLTPMNARASVSITHQVPMGRVAEAREVADAVLYLVSDEASYVTGATLTVDGGLLT